MKQKLLMYLMSLLIEAIAEYAEKEGLWPKVVDWVCDMPEKWAYNSDNVLFKKAVGRVTKAIREQLDVPDDDDITPEALLNHPN